MAGSPDKDFSAAIARAAGQEVNVGTTSALSTLNRQGGLITRVVAAGNPWRWQSGSADAGRPWDQVPALGGGYWQREVSNPAVVPTTQLNADNTGSTNVQPLLNTVSGSGTRNKLLLTPGTYLLGGTLNRDYRSSIWGEEHSPGTTTLKSTINDGSTVVRNVAFTDPYVGNQKDSLFGIWLKDVEIKGTVTGGVKQNAVGVETQNSTQRMENVRIGGFAKGIYNAPQSNFLQVWNYLTVTSNTLNVEWPDTTGGNSNSGENITINGGFYGGADTCFVIRKGWSIRMFAPSIDYNKNVFQFVSDAGSAASTPSVDLFAAHIEDKSGNPFIQNNFGNGGGSVTLWGGVFLRLNTDGLSQLPITKANIIDPGCGPFQTVSFNRVRTADRILSAEWSSSQVNPAGFTLPIDYTNMSGIDETFWITVTHAPTSTDGSFFEMRAGISTLSTMGTSARPANTPAGHSDLLCIRVPAGQKFGAIGSNVSISVRRQGDS